MPRKAKLYVPGGLYYVILSDHGRQAIFIAHFDRRCWMRR